jgi:hypothetical protein
MIFFWMAEDIVAAAGTMLMVLSASVPKIHFFCYFHRGRNEQFGASTVSCSLFSCLHYVIIAPADSRRDPGPPARSQLQFS